MQADIMSLPVKDTHLRVLAAEDAKVFRAQRLTFSSLHRTGSLKSDGTDMKHCSPAQIMNPHRASMLWQFTRGLGLHSTLLNSIAL